MICSFPPEMRLDGAYLISNEHALLPRRNGVFSSGRNEKMALIFGPSQA
jgi:hypothetical protein